MQIFWTVFGAITLDLLIGDPRWFPHPVRLIGKWANTLEVWTRAKIRSPFWAGLWTSVFVYLPSFFVPFFLVKWAQKIHPYFETALSIFIIYTTIAIHDLLKHSMSVYRALKCSDLIEARIKVGMIVGRDVENLSRNEIIRACVESVAESLVDGITAPLFFGIFGGPAWAMLYRAMNTLDSLFGYKNEKYIHFGTVSAKIDDFATYIPARLSSPFICLASAFLFFHPFQSFRILLRDGNKHPSPNSGLSEAAVAGALGIRLGGLNFYKGVPSPKPVLGEGSSSLHPTHILQVNRLILITSFFSAFFFIFLRRVIFWQ